MLCKVLYKLYDIIRRFNVKYIKRHIYRKNLGYCGKNVDLRFNHAPGSLDRVFMYDNTNIYHDFRFISAGGKFIMKKNSGSAAGLTVITGNHQRVENKFFIDISGGHQYDVEKDVIVEEDVWIGANVTLLSGVTVGRGATVGAASTCIKSVPPYAVVMGNPAKVVGFCFTPEEVIEHEKALYPEEERLPLELLEKNYKKYFLDHIKEIKAYTGLICK